MEIPKDILYPKLKNLDQSIKDEADTSFLFICNNTPEPSHHEIFVKGASNVKLTLNGKTIYPVFTSHTDHVFLYIIPPNKKDTIISYFIKNHREEFRIFLKNSDEINCKHDLRYPKFGLKINLSFFMLGAVVLLMILSLIYFVFLRERFFLYYALYLVSIICFNTGRLYFTDIAYYNNFSNFGKFDHALNSIQLFYYITYFSFLRAFVNTKIVYPLVDKLCKFAIIYSIISLPLLYLCYYQFGFSAFDLYFIIYRVIISSVSLILLIIGIRLNDRLMNFIVAGCCFLLLGALISLFVHYNVHLNPFKLWPIHYMNIGALIEVIFFSFGIGYKMFLMANEKSVTLEKLNQLQIFKEHELKEQIEKVSNALKTQQTEQLQTALELKEKEMEMDILRSQINPHFLFNTINALKSLTIKGDIERAKKYFDDFSNLLRLILENSRSKKIALASELSTIKIYIELENLRLQYPVKFDVNVEKNIDTSFIEIPPTMIQPFIENAIWHGLSHKEAPNGQINLHVYLAEENELYFKITDNGIGRDAAALINSSTLNHKSIGISIINERLNIVNNDHKENITFSDLKDSFGNALGTEVIVRIRLY